MLEQETARYSGGEEMDDVRKAAEERAARPKKAPVGASFESERQRSKNALVRQIESMDGRNVRMIAAASATPEEDRVCESPPTAASLRTTSTKPFPSISRSSST